MDKKDGILIIGDPHLSSRNPGFRKDNYSQVILDKVDFALQYAIEHELLPVFLGDIFSTVFLHETSFPLSYRPDGWTEYNFFNVY